MESDSDEAYFCSSDETTDMNSDEKEHFIPISKKTLSKEKIEYFEGMGKDCMQIMHDCTIRGLRSSATWAAELYNSLCSSTDIVFPSDIETELVSSKEFSNQLLAKTYFDNTDYYRASFFSSECKSSVGRFLYYYSLYCAAEKTALDSIVDVTVPINQSRNANLKTLRAQLEKAYLNHALDGYCLYLYGVVLKKLQLEKEAMSILCEAVHSQPLNWSAWLELASLIGDRETLENLTLPSHWINYFFHANTYLELQMNEEALEIYTQLCENGFGCSTYVMSKIAIAHHNMRNLDRAIKGFKDLIVIDPYRLDTLDIYSNILYVKEMKKELSNLAHRACDIDRYRVETCCIIGNFYSLRTQHEKAVVYFQRALKLDPNYLSAWTLMGHEYMEMKNTSFAIHAYRHAIEVNKKDYRAWYGLGQTYELLKMHYYCLYYYKQAQLLRPHDSRMMIAVGEAYEKLEKNEEAKKCFWKAHTTHTGDAEGVALLKLAKMYYKLDDDEQAAAAFRDYVRDVGTKDAPYKEELNFAYIVLARYYFKKRDPRAIQYAQNCLKYPELKDEARYILRHM